MDRNISDPPDEGRSAFDDALWNLVRKTSATWGQEFFRELTRALSVALDMQYVTVSELTETRTLRTLAFWVGEDWGERIEYDLAGTPCYEVVEAGTLCLHGHGVQERFPDDLQLAAWEVESYLGAPLIASGGEVIGNLCLLDRRPIRNEALARRIIGPFASRASAELDRIRTERELESQRAFLRQVLDINPSLIFTKDREGRFTLVNRSVADVYGTTIEELTGKTDADFNPKEEEVAFFRKMDLEVMDTQRERFIPEEPLTDAGGRVRWVQTIKRPIVGPDGRSNQVLGVATDITELKRTRDQLLEHQEREREAVQAELDKVKSELVRQTRLATIGQVAASIAHELRNPLGVIRNAVFYLRRRGSGSDPTWAEYLQIIDQEVQHSDRIIVNLLEMSRPKDPSRERLDLDEVVRGTFERIRGIRPIELVVSLEPVPFLVEADGGQLRQVFANLITNSLQAMEETGRIVVAGRREKGWDVITIRDDGPGMPAEIRESVFEPLFTTKAKGTGLGLSICRQILERHGGSIETTDAGRGAAFEIRLPSVGSR